MRFRWEAVLGCGEAGGDAEEARVEGNGKEERTTRMWKFRAYCYFGNAERTFLLDRIADAIPMDTNFSILT